MNRYRLFNRILSAFADITTTSPEQACRIAGWKYRDCWIRIYTSKGGWKNETPRTIGTRKP